MSVIHQGSDPPRKCGWNLTVDSEMESETETVTREDMTDKGKLLIK